MKNKILLIALLAALLLVNACGVQTPTQNPPTLETKAGYPAATETPAETAYPVRTETPAETPVPEPTNEVPPGVATLIATIDHKEIMPPLETILHDGQSEEVAPGISFKLPQGVASGIKQELVPEEPADEYDGNWDRLPEHWQIKFTGYNGPESLFEPEILIIPIEEYKALMPELVDNIDLLASVLNNADYDEVTPWGGIPYLPFVNAGQIIIAKPLFFAFQNGRGVGYVTQFGQAYLPIVSAETVYAFQGITDDGKYLLSAWLPIGIAGLPGKTNLSEFDFEAFQKEMETYYPRIMQQINALPDSGFTPSLDALNGMMSSFSIKP